MRTRQHVAIVLSAAALVVASIAPAYASSDPAPPLTAPLSVCADHGPVPAGYNLIQGTPLDDVLVGTPGNDLIRGLRGNDRLYGRTGNDMLYGGNGIDRLWGEDGSDRLFGEGDVDGLDAHGEDHVDEIVFG